MKSDTMAALTRVKLDLNNKKTNCFNYEITDNMLKFNDKMYDKDETRKELAGVLFPEEPDETNIYIFSVIKILMKVYLIHLTRLREIETKITFLKH